MRIEVYNGWIIRSDERNVILCKSSGVFDVTDKKTKVTKPTERFASETYHASVEQALSALCRKEINTCKATTFKGLQHEYTALKTMLNDIGRQLGESTLTEEQK